MANYTLLNTTSTKHNTEKTLVANIDGQQVDTLEKFYQELIVQLKFSDDFGRNLDAFDEMINDLDWLDETTICLVFKNYDDFLSEENNEAREIILTILDDAAAEWKRYEDTKNLRMYIEPSELAEEDLEAIGLDYKTDD
jgi:RNAse (barnase) inhibitor barstar